MPHIRVRGMYIYELEQIKKDMLNQLSELMETEKTDFTLEYLDTVFIFDEKQTNRYPYVEVAWFDRGTEIKEEVAKCITDHVKRYDYEYVTVYFHDLIKENYFENYKHF
jgi:phenylpyruvate tautomerase PptA (4-oxalocrotonate tautomerase family)